jgi:hypothetical protein
VSPDSVAATAAAAFTGRNAKATVQQINSFVYYPRVSQADAQSGWYQRLDAMQGRRRTYHAGGLVTFWDVEHAMRSGLDAAQRFF